MEARARIVRGWSKAHHAGAETAETLEWTPENSLADPGQGYRVPDEGAVVRPTVAHAKARVAEPPVRGRR